MKKILLFIIISGILIFLISAKSIKNHHILKRNTNDFKHICNFKEELKYRYSNYYKTNKNLSLEDIVTRVNIPNNLEKTNSDYSKKGMMLVKEAKDMFEKMYYDAKKEGYNIRIMSSYRSYNYQEKLYNNYKNKEGKEEADKYSARPGFSEHQTGLCVDIDDKNLNYEDFYKSSSYEWMINNSYKYGFILRYPKDKENITGYIYESWHYRYVGIDIAKYIHDNNITFDEYYSKYIR